MSDGKSGPGETSPGGSVIKSHREDDRRFELVAPVSAGEEAVKRHVERHLGPVESVLHERVSSLIHLDVLVVAPRPQRNFYTLVTAGMSDRPMNAPVPNARFAELLIALPADWRLADADRGDENNFWPIRLLRTLARLPHEFSTWLWAYHTVPNGDPPKPYADNTRFTGAAILPPVRVPQAFWTLPVDRDKTISFLAVYPLHEGEMRLKLERGAQALMDRLARHRVTELLDIGRADVSR